MIDVRRRPMKLGDMRSVPPRTPSGGGIPGGFAKLIDRLPRRVCACSSTDGEGAIETLEGLSRNTARQAGQRSGWEYAQSPQPMKLRLH